MTPLYRHLAATLGLTDELGTALDELGLHARNGAKRSNTIGGQLWCVVGARESYARAIESGSWQGFSCGLDEPHSPNAVRVSLSSSKRLVLELLQRLDRLSDTQEDFLLSLLEHESQHHGQLIRYFFANDLPFPAAFASRYSLS